MDIAALGVELKKPDYAALDDQAAADTLNAQTQKLSLVPRWRVKKHLYECGAWGAMRLAVTTVEDQNLKALLLTAFDYLNDPEFENLDLDLSAVSLMLSALTSAGLLTQNDRDAIEAMRPTVPLFVETITAGMVAEARRTL